MSLGLESNITHYNATNNCLYYETDDSDSGLVADACDVLPDEEELTLPVDFDYEDLLLDLSSEFETCRTDSSWEENLGRTCLDTNVKEKSEAKEILLSTDDVSLDSESYGDCNNVEAKKKSICTTTMTINEKSVSSEKTSSHSPHQNEHSSKVKTFSREQARQWRRKRILNAAVKTNVDKKPTSLQPLLPLPGKLKPITTNERNNKNLCKLLDPLQGGEKIRNTRGPQPMKLRALPSSFWKEPSSVHTSSLARSNYSVLPPLFSAESDNNTTEVMDVRPVTPPGGRSRSPRNSPKKKLITSSEPNTGLLFSLFDHLENTVDERLIVRRGRPKKTYIERIPPPPRRSCEGDDPCIVDDLANKLFPELSLHNKQSQEKGTNFAIVRIGKGERTIEFSAIQAEENYPAMLNELITHM